MPLLNRKAVLSTMIRHETLLLDDIGKKENMGFVPDKEDLKLLLDELTHSGYLIVLKTEAALTYSITDKGIREGKELTNEKTYQNGNAGSVDGEAQSVNATGPMTHNTNKFNLDDATIFDLGLRLSTTNINAQIALDARIFEYPQVAGVYIMESDLYGNTMPAGSCFIAFNGRSGLSGKHISIEALKRCSPEGIRKIVADNDSG